MTYLTLDEALPGQTTTDAAGLSPSASVGATSSASATPYVAVTTALSTTADGALSPLGVGTLSADGATYMVRDVPADVQATALRGLVFTSAVSKVESLTARRS